MRISVFPELSAQTRLVGADEGVLEEILCTVCIASAQTPGGAGKVIFVMQYYADEHGSFQRHLCVFFYSRGFAGCVHIW